MQRLLQSVSEGEKAEAVGEMQGRSQRQVFSEQARNKTRYQQLNMEGTPQAGLKPWREIITPHPDVASGQYMQAEFAADLAQVYRGEGSDEYRDPHEFYRRTFLTVGLRDLLTGALERIGGTGGDPVVELQTNFGGGKTHSMLALFHLFSGVETGSLEGIEPVLKDAGVHVGSQGESGCAGGHGAVAGRGQHEARWHRGADALGRDGMAARRRGRLRPGRGVGSSGDEPGLGRSRESLQEVQPVPRPDRRVGGLRATARRQDRPSGR